MVQHYGHYVKAIVLSALCVGKLKLSYRSTETIDFKAAGRNTAPITERPIYEFIHLVGCIG